MSDLLLEIVHDIILNVKGLDFPWLCVAIQYLPSYLYGPTDVPHRFVGSGMASPNLPLFSSLLSNSLWTESELCRDVSIDNPPMSCS
jgi:hypothetical protein